MVVTALLKDLISSASSVCILFDITGLTDEQRQRLSEVVDETCARVRFNDRYGKILVNVEDIHLLDDTTVQLRSVLCNHTTSLNINLAIEDILQVGIGSGTKAFCFFSRLTMCRVLNDKSDRFQNVRQLQQDGILSTEAIGGFDLVTPRLVNIFRNDAQFIEAVSKISPGNIFFVETCNEDPSMSISFAVRKDTLGVVEGQVSFLEFGSEERTSIPLDSICDVRPYLF